MSRIRKEPNIWISLTPIVCLVVCLACVISVFGSDALNGGSQVALIIATAVCIEMSYGFCGAHWHDFERAMTDKVKDTAVSIFILLLIGSLSASWMLSGIVPSLICYGIQIIHPSVFLVCACAISAVVSITVGSSWTTIATIGIALLGIGRAEDFADCWIAGAIISGAYFGDKLSPLSDTTVLASSISGTPLFQHIRYMLLTTIPTFAITLLIFFVAGLFMGHQGVSDVAMYTEALNSKFNITPWLLLVPVFTGYLIYRRTPSLIVLFTSTLLATAVALIAQPDIISNVGGEGNHSFNNMFRGTLVMLTGSTSTDTGHELINSLVETRGMAGMLNTIWLIICATCFAGAMTASGMLKCFVQTIFNKMRHTRLGLVTSTVVNAFSMNVITSDQYMSVVLTANMFRDEYEEQGYENRLLSRSCEDGATVTSVLIPWNTCGLAQSTVLGVATLVYAPYCFFCYLSPLMSILHAALGYKIYKKEPLTQTTSI